MRSAREFPKAAGLAVLFGVLALATAPPQQARAATFTVTSTFDMVDSNIGDGVCAAAPSGKCTLRAAVMEANALSGSHKIVLQAARYSLTIAGRGEDDAQTGDLDIRQHLTIVGKGAANTIVDGNGTDRVFDVIGNLFIVPQVALAGLTVTGGSADNGGGIRTLGPAIVRVTGCTIRNNVAMFDGKGGGIYNFATMTIASSTLAQNSAGRGGGIYSYSWGLSLFGTRVLNNTASREGGGVFADDSILKIVNSSVANNAAVNFFGPALGGGLYCAQVSAPARVQSTKITGNQAVTLELTGSGSGGGVYLKANGAGATFSGCAIQDNAVRDMQGGGSGGGTLIDGNSPVAFTNRTIISRNITGSVGGGVMGPFGSITLTGGAAARNNIPDNIHLYF